MTKPKIIHFSDILCVWAYVAQSNLSRLAQDFGDQIDVEVRYCSVFPDSHGKIDRVWADRGGFTGYAAHVRDVVTGFPDVSLNDDTWVATRPRSSASPHQFIKVAELIEAEQVASGNPLDERLSVRAAKELRRAFFVEAQDISHWDVQREVANRLDMNFDDVLRRYESGEAIARLVGDYELAQIMKIEGSPTYVLNEGRQRLYGNVSYGIVAANVREILSSQLDESASACS
ncbi:DsbA family protein [uncultured Shimia sp.]|uniref:DsbA family oxidoreductase n=1 Tax=uncultured Shimia sp. TaxID=573152 RepID=UPI0026234D53|nr:DsbA family protein [uncultured Shimia sp.]